MKSRPRLWKCTLKRCDVMRMLAQYFDCVAPETEVIDCEFVIHNLTLYPNWCYSIWVFINSLDKYPIRCEWSKNCLLLDRFSMVCSSWLSVLDWLTNWLSRFHLGYRAIEPLIYEANSAHLKKSLFGCWVKPNLLKLRQKTPYGHGNPVDFLQSPEFNSDWLILMAVEWPSIGIKCYFNGLEFPFNRN